MYPLFLELTAETSFPVEESIPVALISISTALQGVILMELDSILANPLDNYFQNPFIWSETNHNVRLFST